MAILVTGGAGYIGSHTCIELLKVKQEIVVADNFCNSKPEVLDRIREISGQDFKFYEIDLLDETGVNRLFEQNTIDAVIHFAGLKAVGESVQMPLEYYHNNITGTLLLCAAMQKFGCNKIVFSSSATVYGMNNTSPFHEDMLLSATNPYGYTKLFIEQILTDFCVANPAWSVALLRYFNPIGADASGLIGEDPNGIPNNLFPYLLQVAAGRLEKLSIFGNDYDTPDGTGVRDYIHVGDLARGHLAALQYLQTHTGAETINLGSGCGSSVLELLHTLEQACGKTLPHQFVPRRPGDIATCYADPTKAKELLHWQTEKSLVDMCVDGWNYARKKYRC